MIKHSERNKVRLWEWSTRAWLFFAVCFFLLCPVETNAADLSSDQQGIFENFGYPDSFTLLMTKAEENDPLRYEAWDYYRVNTSFIFQNGMLVNMSELKDLPDWMVLPVIYRPDRFETGMTWMEVFDEIIGDKEFDVLSLPEDKDLPDMDMVSAEQILMGFDGPELVFVRTVPVPLILGGLPGESEGGKGQ